MHKQGQHKDELSLLFAELYSTKIMDLLGKLQVGTFKILLSAILCICLLLVLIS